MLRWGRSPFKNFNVNAAAMSGTHGTRVRSRAYVRIKSAIARTGTDLGSPDPQRRTRTVRRNSTARIEGPTVRRQRKSPAGIATNDLIVSASQGVNADVFPDILSLYVPSRSRIADVTYGRGAFWKHVAPKKYHVIASDLTTGVDCRKLPYADVSLDCVVLDPP